MDEPIRVVNQITSYLKLDIHPNQVRDILWKYDKKNGSADMTGLHFNKAVKGRYANEMSEDQLRKVWGELGKRIVKMRYKKLLLG